jgi:hypothetical protein
MPLTAAQKDVVRIILFNRSPESHLAGGAVINRDESGLRFSDDLDIFHDLASQVSTCAMTDTDAIRAAGYSVDWKIRNEGFYQAEVRLKEERVRLDWTTDSVIRFFPVQIDEMFGFCLHQADLATNKVLALAGRTEIRDFLDMIQIDRSYLSLAATVWAACGNDPGFAPELLLDQANRHSRFQEVDLLGENLAHPVDLRELKNHWISARERAVHLFDQLPSEDLGCLYLDQEGNPVTPDPDSPDFDKLIRHKGSIRGAWPRIS